MPDWTKAMTRTYEYYTVDPGTWKDVKLLKTVKSCSINRNSTTETLGSATFDIDDMLGEMYVRAYLITIQNGIRERHPLGTFIVQTPSTKFDGRKRNVSMDAFSPLIELKENPPPLGYSITEGENIMDYAYRLIRENARAPVIKAVCSETLNYDFVADTDDTWMSFLIDLIYEAKYSFGLDELGRILFMPNQKITSLQPVWTFNDDNSSILLPEATLTHDLFDVPNVVEVIYATNDDIFYTKVVNDDPNSPTSTINRGREIKKRFNNPSIGGNPTQLMVEEYAERLLKELSTVEYTITYSHGYCPVRVGDCVRLNYKRAGMDNIKALVVSQTIDCDAKCTVSETAVFTNKLWG